MDGQDSARRRPAGRIPRPNAPCPGRRRPGGCLPHPFLDTPAGPRFDRSSPLFGVLCLSLGDSACWRSPGRLHRPSARRPRSGPDSNSPSRCPSRCPTCAPNRPSSCASGGPPARLAAGSTADAPRGARSTAGVPLAVAWGASRSGVASPSHSERWTAAAPPGDARRRAAHSVLSGSPEKLFWRSLGMYSSRCRRLSVSLIRLRAMTMRWTWLVPS